MLPCDIGYAVRLLKMGKKVRRLGWHDKTRFLWLKQATSIKAEWCKDPQLRKLAEDAGGDISGLGTVCMYSAGNHVTGPLVLTGWLPTACDLLADDWECVLESGTTAGQNA